MSKSQPPSDDHWSQMWVSTPRPSELSRKIGNWGQPKPGEASAKKVLIAAAVVFVILAVFGSVYLFSLGADNAEDTPPSPSDGTTKIIEM